VLFDSSLHFHFSQSWQGYPMNAIPSIVRNYRLTAEHADGSATVIADIHGNHLRNRRHAADLSGVIRLRLDILATHGIPRAQIYAVRVF
jgi:hypothetical protein